MSHNEHGHDYVVAVPPCAVVRAPLGALASDTRGRAGPFR